MDSLIEKVVFGNCSSDFDDLLGECKEDFYSSEEPTVFVGISLSECEEGLMIKARHSCQNKQQLLAALQGAINLYFAKHPQEDENGRPA